MYDATDAIQHEQAKAGGMRNLSRIRPYLEGLRGYEIVIASLGQSTDDIVSLIWGPIKLLLCWTYELNKPFDAIIHTFADIGFLLPEFREIQRLSGENELIKKVLILFFRNILAFCIIVLKFFRQTCESTPVSRPIIVEVANEILDRGRIFEFIWTRQQEKIRIIKARMQRHILRLRREVSLEDYCTKA